MTVSNPLALLAKSILGVLSIDDGLFLEAIL